MRRSLAIFLALNLVAIGYLTFSLSTLFSLLIVDGSDDAILPSELPASMNWTLPATEPHLIPKIIHQTYKNTTIPDVWIAPQRSCIDFHPEYEYRLWTDESGEQFIADEYPWFLETWKSYPYNIQRADVIRYFVLYHYGGIYIDLDDGCHRPLDPLLNYSAWLRKTTPSGISNDAMGSIPKHPFFLRAIESLQDYHRSWMMPYITVMASTGPLFLSLVWRHYNMEDPTGPDRVRVLFPDEYNAAPWSFFTHHLGNSWHEGDVLVIMWLRDHWLVVTAVGFVLFGIVLSVSWTVFGRLFSASPNIRSAGRRGRPRISIWPFSRDSSSPQYVYQQIDRTV